MQSSYNNLVSPHFKVNSVVSLHVKFVGVFAFNNGTWLQLIPNWTDKPNWKDRWLLDIAPNVGSLARSREGFGETACNFLLDHVYKLRWWTTHEITCTCTEARVSHSFPFLHNVFARYFMVGSVHQLTSEYGPINNHSWNKWLIKVQHHPLSCSLLCHVLPVNKRLERTMI